MISEQQIQIQGPRSQEVKIVQDSLTQLVKRGMSGDRGVLPAIREMLDQTPALWENASGLADRTRSQEGFVV